MSTTNVIHLKFAKLKEKEPIELATGKLHRIILERPIVHLLEAEDLYFNTESAILLPDLPATKIEL